MIAFAAAGLAIAAVGTAASLANQKKALKETKKANKFERQRAELTSARQKTQAIRETRVAQANSVQAAENQGVSNSSTAQGGQGSIISQMNSNLSFLDQYGFLGDQASKHMGKAQSAGARSSMWGQVADFGAQMYSMSGGFSGPKPPAAPK
jgi:hypothetical protein